MRTEVIRVFVFMVFGQWRNMAYGALTNLIKKAVPESHELDEHAFAALCDFADRFPLRD